MGAILNLGLRFSGVRISSEQIRGLMDPHAPTAARAVEPALRGALGGALHWVFVAMTVLSVLALLAALTMPKRDLGETLAK